MGQYKDQISAQQIGLEPSQIRANKCAKVKARNENKKERTAAKVAEMMRARELRGDKGQISELDFRLGKGVGAKRERARLAKLIG